MLHLFGELIFPRRCAACQVEIDSGLLCDDCRNGLKEMRDFPPVDHLDGGLILFAYEGFIKQAIHKVKFFHDKKIPYLLAEEAELLLNEPRIRESMINFLKGAGILSYNAENYNEEKNILRSRFEKEMTGQWLWSGIPTDLKRLRERGFDLPTLLFANRASDFGGTWQKILCRTRTTLPMYGLGPEERRQNLQECFATVRNVAGKSVLLVDDIFTTGATFSAGAEELKKAGAVTVKGLAFCGSVENLR